MRAWFRRPLPVLVAVVGLTLAACAAELDETDVTEDTSDEDAAAESDAQDGPDEAEDASSAETLTIAIGGDEGSLTPYTYRTGYPGWNLLGLVWDTLLVLDASNEPQPLLAADWSIDEAGTTWTFALRDDVTWHDGEPFTAADVAFTFDYVTEFTQSRWTNAVAGVVEVTVVDEYELTIELDAPDPEFAIRPLADMPMLPEHLWSQVDDPDGATIDEAVGTGPYRLVEYEQDQRYRLDANADYFLGAPRVDVLNIAVFADPSTAFAALRSGEIDMSAIRLEPQLVDQFESADDLSVARGSGFASTLLQVNTGRPLLDRVEVRQAIGLAIDPQELIDVVLLGTGTPPNPGFVHPDSPLADPSLAHTFDPQAANTLLDQLGAEVGEDGSRTLDGEPLAFELLVYADNPSRIRAAELIQEYLAAVGIVVTVSPQEAVTVDDQVWPGFDVAQGRDFDLSMWGWSAPVMLDAGRIAALGHSDPAIGTLNIGGLNDPEVDAAADAVRDAEDAEGRDAASREFQAALAEARPFVTLYYADEIYGYRPASYDGWVFQDGQGILSKLSFVDIG